MRNKRKIRGIYKKIFARDFCLGLLELWYYGEASGPRRWTTEEQPYKPYVISQGTENNVKVFVDSRGIEWAKSKLLSIFKKDRSFVKKICNELSIRYKKYERVFEHETVLSPKKLGLFTEHVREAWPWFEALWWLIEALEEKPQYKKDLDLLLRARRETEKIAPATDAIIRKSIARAYPTLAKYSGVILLNEASKNKIPSKNILETRLEGYYYTDDRLFPMYAKQEIERKYNLKFEEITEITAKEFKGQTAYKGKAVGKIRRIFGVKQVPLFQKGEILVAASTTPDLLPAMKKAAAFISDEGGIICHAAIVARELKKPCIIGTKNAMNVLKDGDLIEVDANKGVVKILKRAS